MTMQRYENDSPIQGGKIRKTATAVMNIRQAIDAGSIGLKTAVLKQAQRLDVIAGQEYGDGRLWWVIAAASDVGWAMQCPAGTRVVIPTDLSEVASVM